MYGHDKAWFWAPPGRGYEPSDAIGLLTTLRRKRLLESVAHTLLFEFLVLRGGQTFHVDRGLLEAFDRACSVDGPFYALKDTVFLGSFSPVIRPLVIRTRVARVLLDLISCGLWTLEGFGVQSMTSLSPSLLPPLSWMRSHPVTRSLTATTTENVNDMSVDSLDEGSSGTGRVTRQGSASSGDPQSEQLMSIPMQVSFSQNAPGLPSVFSDFSDDSPFAIVALAERTLAFLYALKSSGLRPSEPPTMKTVCEAWPSELALGIEAGDNTKDRSFGGARPGSFVKKGGNTLVSHSDFSALLQHLDLRFKDGSRNRERLFDSVAAWKEMKVPFHLRQRVPLSDPITSWYPSSQERRPATKNAATQTAAVPPSSRPTQLDSVVLDPPFWADPKNTNGFGFSDSFIATVRHLKIQCCVSGKQIRHVLSLAYFLITKRTPLRGS